MDRRTLVRLALAISFFGGVAWLLWPREYRAPVNSYAPTNDAHRIVLHVSVGPDDIVVGSEVREDTRTVVVTIRARDVGRANVGPGDSQFVTVTLKDPVGDRTVIDGTDLGGLAGHVVPRGE